MAKRDPSLREERVRLVTSPQNIRVKELRRLFHEAVPNQQGEVAVEGLHLVEEAIRSGLRLAAVFFAESAQERADKLLPQLSQHTETLLLPDKVFSGAVPTKTPQGIAALVRIRAHSPEEVQSPQPALLVIAAGLQDPGNLGTIARSAEAFGATGLLVTEKTVSPWNWRAMRASAGSLFRLPWASLEMADVLAELPSRGIAVLATSSHKGAQISEADLTRPLALVLGNEGEGLPKDLLAKADEVIAIPHSPRVESLNAAIAASVVLYEAMRQRSRE
jgi:TrmH family RNA methyltransferase